MSNICDSFAFAGCSKLLSYIMKVIFQSISLMWTLLFEAGATEFVLLQVTIFFSFLAC